MSNDYKVLFGHPAEWGAFAERNARFLERFGRLQNGLNATNQVLEKPDTSRILLHFACREAAEDFLEILLLCGNSEAYAAHKLLRSMFEHVVLVKYLSAYPEHSKDYFDFYWVSMFRQMKSIERHAPTVPLDPERVKETTENYERVRSRFKGRKCAACGHSEPGISWSPMAFADMAAKVGLGAFIYTAYQEPLTHVHANVTGLLNRMEQGDTSGTITFRERLSREKADHVLLTAHALLLVVFAVQVEHFGFPSELYATLRADYRYVWGEEGWLPAEPAPSVSL